MTRRTSEEDRLFVSQLLARIGSSDSEMALAVTAALRIDAEAAIESALALMRTMPEMFASVEDDLLDEIQRRLRDRDPTLIDRFLAASKGERRTLWVELVDTSFGTAELQ